MTGHLLPGEPPTIAADLCSFSFLTCEQECDVGSMCPVGWATGCPGMWLSMVSGGVCEGLSWAFQQADCAEQMVLPLVAERHPLCLE